MANNIRELRLDQMWTQQRLCEEVNLEGFDCSLLSKMENGLCEPTDDQVFAIARALSVPPILVTGQWTQLDIPLGKPSKPRREPSFEMEELWQILRKGRENAISREDLRLEMDLTDRRVRQLIEESYQFGVLIGNVGDGYFLIETEGEFRHYYHQELKRSVSNFRKINAMKKFARARGFMLNDCV